LKQTRRNTLSLPIKWQSTVCCVHMCQILKI